MLYTHGIIMLDKNRSNVLLVHPTGHKRDFWEIPKGLGEPGEAPLASAIREFTEETGNNPYAATDFLQPLGVFVYANRKKSLIAFGSIAVRNFNNPFRCDSTFERDGRQIPEIDEYWWCPIELATKFMHDTQCLALERYLSMYAFR